MSMKSNGSSSNSEAPKTEVPKTYALLLEVPEKFLEQRELVSSRLWDSLQDLMLAESQAHLEALLRTGEEGHRTVALWIGTFLAQVPLEVQAALRRQENPESEGVDPHGGTGWMESDGESEDST